MANPNHNEPAHDERNERKMEREDEVGQDCVKIHGANKGPYLPVERTVNGGRGYDRL